MNANDGSVTASASEASGNPGKTIPSELFTAFGGTHLVVSIEYLEAHFLLEGTDSFGNSLTRHEKLVRRLRHTATAGNG